MPLTPSQAFEHTQETLAQYLETHYRISHPELFRERAEMLRQRGAIAQLPFIESTPSFATASKLIDLENRHPNMVTPGLAALVQKGIPVDRFPLYVHQEKALLAAFGEQPNLMVATGTGSGKTETFLLPILSDILREAKTWTKPRGKLTRGHLDPASSKWISSRQHETRPAAMRGIILYPMNALVNDQLTRLRRILSRGDSPDWQRENLNGNSIHFGMYTGLSNVSGSPNNNQKREDLKVYLDAIETDWQEMSEKLRATGNWPRPDSTEMLVRWDMQAAPPDLMVTNYSMLEYMLLRPIEDPMFIATRKWLNETEGARFTLVLDEAHTYTGAKGTEVAHLVRRLKQRLGLENNDVRFRAIATTASVPTNEDAALRVFVSGLFGESADRFTLVEAAQRPVQQDQRNVSPQVMNAYAKFHDEFDLENARVGIESLAKELKLELDGTGEENEVVLYGLLKDDPYIAWARERTARKATPLNVLADELWLGQGDSLLRERALSGVLAAGSFARSSTNKDMPPLLSVRLHAFFRGVSGLWACTDPKCSCANQAFERPVGKLYLEPRPWCDCGARVLEVFTCRKCGLMFLGGIPDNHLSDDGDFGLWPWSSDLSAEQQNRDAFRIFGVEAPDSFYERGYRSTRTTWRVTVGDEFARPVYEVEPTTDKDKNIISQFPPNCPRCHKSRNFTREREIIEPLATKGVQSFAAIVAEAFRNQPHTDGNPPNYGRKGMVFSDSRSEASKLAEDIKSNHFRLSFRQLLYHILYTCNDCKGSGVKEENKVEIGKPGELITTICPTCAGTKINPNPEALDYDRLKNNLLDTMIERGIDPTQQNIQGFFSAAELGQTETLDKANYYLDASLLQEIQDEAFGLESLGLGFWQAKLRSHNNPSGRLSGQFDRLTNEESEALFMSVIGILLTLSTITAPDVPDKRPPWEWEPPNSNLNLVEEYKKNKIYYSKKNTSLDMKEEFPGTRKLTGAKIIHFNFAPYYRQNYYPLGRYMTTVANKMVALGRLKKDERNKWLEDMQEQLFNGLKGYSVLTNAGKKVKNKYKNEFNIYGIRMNHLKLHPIPETIHQCKSCGKIMVHVLLNICRRCGQETQEVNPKTIQNYNRTVALYAAADNSFDDPFPLKASEHSAQVDAKEARDEERWFQDLFHEGQNQADLRVDLLSVTTTMEMGIDIGSLLFVGLRNVPPTVANYQQRAGRAGRRGSALATVFTFAQFRSHDQYYFEHPPQIVSDNPRVPALHLDNAVIAQRHARSVILQDFFKTYTSKANIFDAWGSVSDFVQNNGSQRLRNHIGQHRAELMTSLRQLVHEDLFSLVEGWVDSIVDEVNDAIASQADKAQVNLVIMNKNLLPKYAFPIDVVKLHDKTNYSEGNEEQQGNTMSRDLKVGISEYAPGAEIPRQKNQVTELIKSVGLYDPFDEQPQFLAQGFTSECENCQAMLVHNDVNSERPVVCEICGSSKMNTYNFFRPKGFTTDTGVYTSKPARYKPSEGLQRSGQSSPARLYTGESSFSSGQAFPNLHNRLYTHVRTGELVFCNHGPRDQLGGFFICPVCGRSLNPDETKAHNYPNDIPPHRGKQKGPRAGDPCPQQPPYDTNQLILIHTFQSEVITLGIALPPEMDAPFGDPVGKAACYSIGTLIANAATRILHIDPGELKTGARAVRRNNGIQGEVFIYDDVPGGAGYARNIKHHLGEILDLALKIGKSCTNPNCIGACYKCMFDYRNQFLHPILDRHIGTAMLEYVLNGKSPRLSKKEEQFAVEHLKPFANPQWTIGAAEEHDGIHYPMILKGRDNRRIGIRVIHPLQARTNNQDRLAIFAKCGFNLAEVNTFDLERRPFWVMNNLQNL